jgi:hypothetical protein
VKKLGYGHLETWWNMRTLRGSIGKDEEVMVVHHPGWATVKIDRKMPR